MSSSQDLFEKRFMNFSIEVFGLIARLPKSAAGRHVADQLLRSGTSVGAHMREARSAESRADLIHKMQMALKEVREAHYWLSLVQGGKMLKEESLTRMVQEANELTAILVASVNTAKRNVEAREK